MTEVLFSHMTEKPTVVALIDAAEAEFAIHGIEGSSLRAIMRAADTDTASIHYHFGNRERLARQVLDRILTPLNIRRVALLDNAVQETIGPIPLAAIIEALARPDIEASLALDERGEGRARLIGAIYVRPSNFVKSLVEERFRPVADKFMPHLILAVPDVPGDVLAWRIRWSLFGMVGALLSDDEPMQHDPEALIRQIVTSASGAVAAQV